MGLNKAVGVDALGGDELEGKSVAQRAVQATIELAQKYKDYTFFLYGNPNELYELYKKELPNVWINNASDEKYGAITKLAKDLSEGKIGGVYTSGKTEIVIPRMLLSVGMLEEFDKIFSGEKNPPLIVELPKYPTVKRSKSWFLLDAGSIPELKRVNQYLVYAQIGKIFAREVKGVDNPGVGLLNIGREANKGTELLRKVYDELNKKKGIWFIGNVEPYLAMNDHEKGRVEEIPVDVVVCDGFSGNTVIKALAAGANLTREVLEYGIKRGNLIDKLAGLQLKKSGVFKRAKEAADPNTYNGALFIGLNKPVIKGHGTADRKGFREGIEKVVKCLESNITMQIQKAFASQANAEF